MNAHAPVLKVDVLAFERCELPGPNAKVDGQRVQPTPAERYGVALHEPKELVGVKPLLGFLVALVRRLHAVGPAFPLPPGVGAPYAAAQGSESGAAYIFRLTSTP